MNFRMRLLQRTSGIWYVEFERDKYRSLKTKDKNEAKKLFSAVRAEYLAGRLSEIRGESSVTLQEFVTEYGTWARSAREKKTYKADMLAIRQLLGVAGGSARLDKLTQKHTDMMVSAAKKRGCAAGTINSYIRHIRAVFSKVVEWRYLLANPFGSVREVPKEKKSPVYLRADEVPSFLASISDIDERRILTAYIYSGRRRAELLRLSWENINFELDEYYVEKSKAHLSKWYPMHPLFREVLESIGMQDSGRIWTRWKHPDTITDIAQSAFRKFGRPEMTLHKLRHTFATLLVDQGIDLNTIGSLLGHTDKRATEIYAHVTGTRQHEAIRKLKAGPVDLEG